MITNIKLIRLADIPYEFQDDLLFGMKGEYKFDDYGRFYVQEFDVKPNTFGAYLILLGCTPGETILIHYVW